MDGSSEKPGGWSCRSGTARLVTWCSWRCSLNKGLDTRDAQGVSTCIVLWRVNNRMQQTCRANRPVQLHAVALWVSHCHRMLTKPLLKSSTSKIATAGHMKPPTGSAGGGGSCAADIMPCGGGAGIMPGGGAI